MVNSAQTEKGQDTSQQDDVYTHLPDEDIREIVDAVRSQDSDVVHSALEDLSNADTAELLSKIKDDDREELLNMYSESLDPEIFTEMDQELTRASLSAMPPGKVAKMISELESDDALLLIETLEPDFQQDIIKKLSAKTRLAMEEGLNFPEDSAGRLMRREMVSIPEFWTVGKTIDFLRTASDSIPEDFFDIFIIDTSHHVTGEIPLSRLVRAKRSEKIQV